MKIEIDTFWKNWLLVPIGFMCVTQVVIWIAGSFIFMDIWWLPMKFHRALFVLGLFSVYYHLLKDALDGQQ